MRFCLYFHQKPKNHPQQQKNITSFPKQRLDNYNPVFPLYNDKNQINKMKKKQAKQNKPSSTKQITSSTKLPQINPKHPTSTIVSQNANPNISSYQDQGLVTLIQEYLLKNNLFDTLQIFQKDCIKGFKHSVKSIEALKKDLVAAFDSGNRQQFMVKFSQYVPLLMRTKDTKTLKMEFYVQLYFFIYGTHPFLGKKKTVDLTAKQNFLSYLEGRGAILSKQQEFLPFYALAYLPKPHQHQTFKSMFTKQWIQEIKKQLTTYLDKLYPPNKTPTIVNMYEKFIELNLEAEKFSSVALTEPDDDYDEMPIQQQIEQNYDESIMNNPQPILLQNPNASNRVMKNNSLQKLNFTSNNPQNMNQLPHSSPLDKQQLISLNQRLSQMQQQRSGLLSYIQNYKKKYQNLQNDFKQFSQSIKTILQESQNKWFRIIQELYNVALDLLNAATNLQEGIPLADAGVLAKRKEKLERYKGFVSMNIEDLLSDNVADYSLFERPEHDLSVDMVKKNTEYFEREQKFIEIDFAKCKSILATVPGKDMLQEDMKQLNMQKYLILQALRQRLTRMRGAFQKRQVVLSYTIFDILGINQNKQKPSHQSSIINTLLETSNYPILLQTTLLISALCKDYYGRQYLFDQKLMIKMMQIRKQPDVDDKIKEIILIIFQLQSNKRSCQVVMIDNGLMEEIVEKLDKERDQIDAFNMEYATALLLNLLLSKKGLDRAQGIKSQILMTLINLMQIENSQVKNFVHASLYPLLARKSFRQKALEFGMQANIKYLLENSPSIEFQHQLKYVYNRLMMQHDEEEEKDDEPEYDEINDEEIGEDIPFINDEVAANALTGEFFLMKKYALTGPDAMQQMVQIKEEVKITFSKAIYFERETNERYSVQTPLLGKGRKSQIQVQKGGFTHNNSVYSNKSSNRVLRSQKNSRIKNTTNIRSNQKQRLDTVQQNGSEASIKQYRQHSKGQYRNRPPKLPTDLKQNNSFQKQNTHLPSFNQKNVLQMDNAEGTFRQMGPEQSPLQGSLVQDFNSININQNAKIINREMVEEELKKQNQQEANLRNRKLKPYEKVDEYFEAFETRPRLVRTPPQKPN